MQGNNYQVNMSECEKPSARGGGRTAVKFF